MSRSHLWLTDSRKSTKEKKKSTFKALLLIKPQYISFLVRLLRYIYMRQTGLQEIDNKFLPLRIANTELRQQILG